MKEFYVATINRCDIEDKVLYYLKQSEAQMSTLHLENVSSKRAEQLVSNGEISVSYLARQALMGVEIRSAFTNDNLNSDINKVVDAQACSGEKK